MQIFVHGYLPANERALSLKLLRIMKLTAYLLTLFCLQLSAGGNAQTVSLSLKNQPIEVAFFEIQKQTGYDFIYTKANLRASKPVTINVYNESLENVLRLCFKDQPLSYAIVDKYIVIKRRQPKKAPDFLEIQGKVTGEHDVPLEGASVIVKRTGRGTLTNATGSFTLRDILPDDIIIVSYTGYEVKSAEAGNETSLQLKLNLATNVLDRTIVQAYGKTTQRYSTGNVTKITAAEIERQPVMNILQALQAKVPGLIISQTSGYASAPFKIELRGRTVINSDLPVEPLFIIDGVPLDVLALDPNQNYEVGSAGITQNGIKGPANGQSPLFSLNPDDVESVTVLKDADALAIYGSRGANGVIIISTKKAKAGQTKLDIDAYTGVSLVTRYYDMLNTKQYLAIRQEAFFNSGETPDAGNAWDLLVWDTTRYTNWQKYFWGDMATNTKVQVSLCGGDKNTTFRIGGAYTRMTNLNTFTGSDQKFSLLFNINHKNANQRLSASFSNIFSFLKSDMISFTGSVLMPPNAPPIFNAEGKLNYAGWEPGFFSFESLLQPYTAKTRFLNSHLKLDYILTRGLTISTNIGYSGSVNTQNQVFPIISQNPIFDPTGTAYFGTNNSSRVIVEPQLEYKRHVGKGQFTALAGGTYQSTNGDGSRVIGTGYKNDNLLHSISNAPVKNATDVWGQYRYTGIFARFNYNWDNKYLLNLSARRDGSSKFGPGRQFGNFGSIGAAWIFGEESLFRNLEWLSFGKLRVSYGITGSDIIGNYNYLTRWTSGNTYQQGSPAYFPLQHANPNLQWQTDKKFEVACNLGFWRDRLLIELAWYQNRVGNQLLIYSLPGITGFNFVTANFPAVVQNRGWESTLTAKIAEQKNFGWTVNFNIGINNNRLYAFPGLAESPYATTFVVGRSLNLFSVLHYTGVDPETGLYMYEDVNKDGQVSFASDPAGDDYIKIDKSLKYAGGLGIDLRYKAVMLNLYFQFQKQLQRNALYTGGWPGGMENIPTDVLDRWQKPGDRARFARYTTVPLDNDSYFGLSDAGYSSAYFFRLNNFSLSWALPSKWVDKAGMRAANIFLRGQNVFVITNYIGADPEIPEFGALPSLTSFTTGFQFDF